MFSVTARIKVIKQPRGGYINPREFKIKSFEDGKELGEENIHRSLIGLAVDYMTRFIMGTPVEEAFKISLLGAIIVKEQKYAEKLLSSIVGLDNKSIYNACKLVGYDVCFRAGSTNYKSVKTIEPDDITINNIRIMVNRSIDFFKEYGPIVLDGFTFEGGYTKIISSGDGDFITKDTLWDFKVSSYPPKPQHTLQLLVYYLMGKHSIHSEFNSIKKLGIFNPRLNCVYLMEISKISKDTIETVSRDVIGYDNERKERNNELTITDVMKELHCTRYMVMKYYSEKNLPLRRINNKYYISRNDFFDWIQEMEEERARKERNTAILTIVFVILFIILLLIVFKNNMYRY